MQTPHVRPLITHKVSLREALASARETRALEIGPGALERSPSIFRELFPDRAAVIVSDAVTQTIAGERVSSLFQRAGVPRVAPFVFLGPFHAEHRFAVELERALKPHNAIPVAVGAGAVTDVVKLAAHLANRPCVSVATAASMDGYTAFGASLTLHGAKQKFDCPAPAAVIADIEILRAAPESMTASGYADLMAKVTAGADWILADALEIEPMDPQAWNIIQGGLREALSNPAGTRQREEKAVFQLTEGLMLGGLAMQQARSSRPASGAEHQFSHLWDMQQHRHHGEAPSHGFQVAIGTLAVTALYEQLLRQDFERLNVAHCCELWPDEQGMEAFVRRTFSGMDFAESSVKETLAKHLSRDALRSQLELLRAVWPELSLRLSEHLMPFEKIKSHLEAAGAPIEPEQIGISRQRLRESFVQACCIRRRFTVLDLAMRTQTMESSLNSLFEPGGLWATHQASAPRC